MKKTCLLFIFSLWILLLASPALAGAPAVKLVIKDPQKGTQIEVTEPALLGFFALFDFQTPLAQAPQVTDGIKIIRYWDTGPFDSMHYYFGANGAPIYVFYEGGLGSDSEHKWYTASTEADQRLRSLLGRQNENKADRLPRILVVFGASIVMLCLLGLILYWSRRRIPRSTANNINFRPRV